MSNSLLSVREIKESDVELVTAYWEQADESYLRGMGADKTKLPKKEQWIDMLTAQIKQDYTEKQAYCIIWLINGVPSGHSNVNKIVFGKEAFMHLHLWHHTNRARGAGVQLVRKSIPWFFEKLQIDTLYCEPYALNPAPNRVLEKAGFTFVKEYVTVPGFINFEQPVKQWQMTRKTFLSLEK